MVQLDSKLFKQLISKPLNSFTLTALFVKMSLSDKEFNTNTIKWERI